MNFYVRRFNLYLLLLLAAWAADGCAWTKKKIDKVGAIRVHMEAPVAVEGKTQAIKLLRSQPVVVVVDNDPVVTERNIIAATLLESPGGFSLRVKFDETGAWMIEQATAANPGKHLVIYCQWGETISECRWLGAPVVNRRIADGTITFTPDADRDEMIKLVEGLNHTAKLLNTKQD